MGTLADLRTIKKLYADATLIMMYHLILVTIFSTETAPHPSLLSNVKLHFFGIKVQRCTPRGVTLFHGTTASGTEFGNYLK